MFNWLWPPLVQRRLNTFREYWNNHTIRSQKLKANPSGTSPLQMWSAPQSVVPDSFDCSIKVRPEFVAQLREDLGGDEGRDAALRFVPLAFEDRAEEAYELLGRPPIELESAWDVFRLMVDQMRGMV